MAMGKLNHLDRKQKRDRRRIRILKKIAGTSERPRLVVFKSRKYIYVQAVDDTTGTTLASASSLEPSLKASLETSGKNTKVAEQIGQMVSERLKAKGVETVVFDRGGYLFHGRVKAVAEGARKGGLQF
jgi:large subunit ribosomal protein L18